VEEQGYPSHALTVEFLTKPLRGSVNHVRRGAFDERGLFAPKERRGGGGLDEKSRGGGRSVASAKRKFSPSRLRNAVKKKAGGNQKENEGHEGNTDSASKEA